MIEKNEHKIPYSNIELIFDKNTEKSINRWVLLLPAAGCAWAKKSGGCLMCGFKFSTYKYSRGRLLPVTVFKFLYNFAYSKIKRKKPVELVIYNGGSYLNDKEIPYKFQIWLAKKIANDSSIKTLFVESRPEYVTEEKIKLLTKNLKGKKLKIGIGLECVSDIIRYQCVNKGFSLKDFEHAIQVLKKYNAEILSYVFIKPLFVSEQEAIKEAIKTAKYAFKVGCDIVAFQSGFVQEKTPMEKLFSLRKYSPPWLWSIIEIARRTFNDGFIELGGFEDDPPPIAIPKNCKYCSPKIYTLLKEFKIKHDIKLFDNLNCNCQKEWQELLKIKYDSLENRIDKLKNIII